MGRRTVLLIAALVVATLATALIYLYVQGVDDAARQGETRVSVLVATGEIAPGTPAEQAEQDGLIDAREFPQSALADGVVTQLSEIQGKVALSTIYEGEELLKQKWGQSGASAATSGLPLSEGQIAMSVQLTDPARVAGFADAGTDVAIFLTSPGTPDEDGVAQPFTRMLLDRVRVLASGQTTAVSGASGADGQQTEEIPLAILTVAVTQAQAQKLMFAQTQGDLYFALLDERSQVDPGRPQTTANNLFGS